MFRLFTPASTAPSASTDVPEVEPYDDTVIDDRFGRLADGEDDADEESTTAR